MRSKRSAVITEGVVGLLLFCPQRALACPRIGPELLLLPAILALQFLGPGIGWLAYEFRTWRRLLSRRGVLVSDREARRRLLRSSALELIVGGYYFYLALQTELAIFFYLALLLAGLLAPKLVAFCWGILRGAGQGSRRFAAARRSGPTAILGPVHRNRAVGRIIDLEVLDVLRESGLLVPDSEPKSHR